MESRFPCEAFAHAASEEDSEIHHFDLKFLVSTGGNALIRPYRL